MKIYVAGSWVEKETRACVAMQKLRDAGHEITHDWATVEQHQTWSNEKDSDKLMPSAERKKRASADLEGIEEADAVLVLAPEGRGSSGMWAEFGFALAMRRVSKLAGRPFEVIVCGENARRTIFTELADLVFPADEYGIEYLKAKVNT